jgi:hypothetical protein
MWPKPMSELKAGVLRPPQRHAQEASLRSKAISYQLKRGSRHSRR